MKHIYVSTHVNTFHINDKWQFLVFNCNDAVTQQINTCTQQLLICRCNHVYLHGIFAYENINVMTFKCNICLITSVDHFSWTNIDNTKINN